MFHLRRPTTALIKQAMTARTPSRADRVEAFISAIDSYEPKLAETPADEFRVFARFFSRSVDGRYLDRHPPDQLLPDIERLLETARVRPGRDVAIQIDEIPGDEGRGVLHTNCFDQPFLYSTVRLALHQLGIKSFRSVNGVIPIQRDHEGGLVGVGKSDAPRESFVWMEIESEDLLRRRDEIATTLRERLQMLQESVDDFYEMKASIDRVADRFDAIGGSEHEHSREFKDGARFLRWLRDEHYILLGTHYVPTISNGEAPLKTFGTGSRGDWSQFEREAKDRLANGHSQTPPFLWVRKSKSASWVYRPGRTDLILVDHHDHGGNPCGLLIIEGLFSFQASAEPRTNIPLLDRVIDELYSEMQAAKGTHRYRTIRNAFNSLPLEYLFSLRAEDVREIVERVLEADSERRLQIHLSTDIEQGTAFVFVALPRSHYNDELRSDIRRLLKETFDATSVDDGVYAGDVDSVTFHYFLTGVEPLSTDSESLLKRAIDHLASPWSDRLWDELTNRFDQHEARRLHNLYAEAFGARYREESSVRRTVNDIELLEGLAGARKFDCDVYREPSDEPLDVTRLRLYESRPILLSEILPILDNFGLVVIDQFPTRVHVPGRAEQRISTFRLGGVDGTKVDLMSRRRRLRSAIRAVVVGKMADEELNRLLLRADVPWSYVVLIRAYTFYARQLGIQFGLVTIRDVLLRNGDVVRALTEFFRAKFDPEYGAEPSTEVNAERLALVARARASLDSLLEGVSELVSDQVLRWFANLIDATVRTNFYSRADHEAHVSLKFDPSRIHRMPDPRPFREVYVHHPQVAGLHLRGGPIARGGIRWSDRPLDYRTEVLSLMATQVLKNVLIIPTGAKGAFILKEPPADLAERRRVADEMYRIFIGGVLDVSDNIVEGEVVTPPRVIRYEEPDPYLVVAADKGTAHLSDVANEVSTLRGFWLGDAFASGGSTGYDHKVEGITARGAWECVRRHFRELGIDPARDEFTVAGIGDMSGDVFGNGLLRTPKAKLLAAFDHRHVFIDPDPNPAQSFEARQELYHRKSSSWADYPPEVVSAGGGTYSRKAKAVQLSPEAQSLLGLGSEPISGNDLVQAVLRLPVDLLWNGGIGTYIKAEEETHFEAGDPPNDLVRVDAPSVRARIVGEGGNLGITQRGRVELALQGVRLNTDAVDNSAGVDLSDHEVNLKILFQAPRRRDAITEEQRIAWLRELKDEANARVLHNNWLQSRMISLDRLRSQFDPQRFARGIEFLLERLEVRRRDMVLPSERVLEERSERGVGLVRPELAMLGALAKQHVRREFQRSRTLTMPGIAPHLRAYFPDAVLESFESDVLEHPLATRAAQTVLLNAILTDAGATWLSESMLRTGGSTEAIVAAYFEAVGLLDAARIKQEIDRIEFTVSAEVEYRLRLLTESAVEKASDWLMRQGNERQEQFPRLLKEATAQILNFVDDDQQRALQNDIAQLNVAGELAHEVVRLKATDRIIDIASVAARADSEVDLAAEWHRVVGNTTGLLALIRRRYEDNDSATETPASFALRDRIRRHLVEMTATVLVGEQGGRDIGAATLEFLDSLRRELVPFQSDSQELSHLAIAADRVERAVGALQSRYAT